MTVLLMFDEVITGFRIEHWMPKVLQYKTGNHYGKGVWRLHIVRISRIKYIFIEDNLNFAGGTFSGILTISYRSNRIS